MTYVALVTVFLLLGPRVTLFGGGHCCFVFLLWQSKTGGLLIELHEQNPGQA